MTDFSARAVSYGFMLEVPHPDVLNGIACSLTLVDTLTNEYGLPSGLL